MTEREKKRLALQLNAVSEQLLGNKHTDAELISTLLQVSGTLAGSAKADQVLALDEAAFSAYFQRLQYLTGQLDACCQAVQNRLETQSAAAEFQQARRDLEEKKANIQSLQELLTIRPEEIEKLEKQIEEERPKAEELERRYEQVSKVVENIRRRAEHYSEENRKKLADQIDVLMNQYMALEPAYRQTHELLTAQEKELQELQEKMAAIPAEKARLVQLYEAAETRLKRLQEADTLCSEEARLRMQEQIAQLEPQVEANSARAQVLQDHLELLKARSAALDTQTDTLSNELLAWLTEHLQELQGTMEGYEEKLLTVRDTAETLNTKLAACAKLHKELSCWLRSDVTPLEAMAKRLEDRDAENLKKTLDPGTLSQVQTLKGRIEEDLKALDAIVTQCQQAMKQDHKAIMDATR